MVIFLADICKVKMVMVSTQLCGMFDFAVRIWESRGLSVNDRMKDSQKSRGRIGLIIDKGEGSRYV